MSTPQPARGVRNFARDEPRSAASGIEAKEAANLANENCDRAMALAHKLTAQLREAQNRINQLESHSEGLRADAELAAKLQSEADARLDRTKREVDERVARLASEAENLVGRLQGELAQARQDADRVKTEADARIKGIRTDADDRITRAVAEVDERLVRARAEMETQIHRLETELTQAELRADRAEQWLVMIRREVEGGLMPSLAAMHDRLRPAKTD
jgi:chromosome segregation ATPase